MTNPGMANRGALAAVLLTVFVNMMGLSIVFPILPLWAVKFGAGADEVGLLVSTFAVGQVAFAFVWGWMSDHWGRRPVILLSVAGTIGSFVIMVFADTLMMLFAARLLAGAMGAAYGVAQAYVADVAAPEKRASAMGWFAAAFSLGFILGPVVGGLLAGADPANPDFRTPFVAAAAISGVALLLGLVTLREPERHSADELPHDLAQQMQSLRGAFATRAVALPIVLLMLMSFVLGGVEATFALWTKAQYGWGPRENGFLFAYVGVLLVIVQGALVGRMSRFMGERWLVLAAGLVGAVGMALFPIAREVWVIVIASGLLAVGIGFAEPALNSLLAHGASPERRGAVMGAAASNRGIGLVFGPSLAGLMFATYGHHSPYVAGAVILALGVTLVLALRAPAAEAAGP